MSDYPKIMTRGGEEISVGGAAEEAEKRADDWCSPLDGPESVESIDVGHLVSTQTDDEPEGPTFGPPHDQTHAKRKGASKKR